MSEELKPCPFCGSEAYIDGYLSGGFFVMCADDTNDCFQPITNKYDSVEEAEEAWNKRAEDK